ncbi:MAG: hypothetical protein U0996_18580 [Planctomycetaceae bacterium]
MKLNAVRRTIESLQCLVIDALRVGQAPRFLVVLNHGFGASGDDLADLAPMLLQESDVIADACRFVFPEAPVDLTSAGMPGGRAWWPINMAKLAEMNQTRNYSELTALKPPGMESAANMLRDAIRTMLQEWNLEPQKLVLGGFSQGAMVSTHVTLENRLQPALLALFSGTLLNSEEWRSLAVAHPGCQVFQSHGYQDPILPFHPAEELRDLLQESGFDVEFQPFHGPHTIPMSALQRLQERLEQLCGKC